MNGINLSSNIENSNKKLIEGKLKLFIYKFDVKKVFSRKLKSKLFNYNNSQIMTFIKKSTDNKNSQTTIKNYNYDLNKVIKQNPTEPLNSISNLKYNSSKDIFPYKMIKIHKKLKETNKTMKNFYKKSNSYKSINIYNSLENQEKEIIKPIFINSKYPNNKFNLGKKIIKTNLNKNSYKYRKKLEKIGSDFINDTNTNNKSYKIIINNYENKKVNSIKNNNFIHNNNNSSSQMNIFLNKYINEPKKTNKKTYFRNNILYQRNEKNIPTKKVFIYYKENQKKINWKNKILNDIITNINKSIYQNIVSKNVELSEDNSHQKIRISTLLNLYNNNSFNYKYKSL